MVWADRFQLGQELRYVMYNVRAIMHQVNELFCPLLGTRIADGHWQKVLMYVVRQAPNGMVEGTVRVGFRASAELATEDVICKHLVVQLLGNFRGAVRGARCVCVWHVRWFNKENVVCLLCCAKKMK